MKREWQEEDITKALKNLARTEPARSAYDHAWFKIEDKIARRQKHLLPSVVWRPWGHPIRWVAAAACLCVAFSGLLYHQDSVDQTELGGYLINVSNTPESVTSDPGLVHVSVLLSEPSSSLDMTVENHADPLAADEIFL